MDEFEKYILDRENALNLYNEIEKVRCPFFNNEFIYFTSIGFNHLVYKGKKKERNKDDQRARFRLLKLATILIEKSSTVQEYEENIEYINVLRNNRLVRENRLVRYWGFVAIFDNQRIKIVIRQSGNGKKEFYSIIPAWFIKNYRGIKTIYNSGNGGISAEDVIQD